MIALEKVKRTNAEAAIKNELTGHAYFAAPEIDSPEYRQQHGGHLDVNYFVSLYKIKMKRMHILLRDNVCSLIILHVQTPTELIPEESKFINVLWKYCALKYGKQNLICATVKDHNVNVVIIPTEPIYKKSAAEYARLCDERHQKLVEIARKYANSFGREQWDKRWRLEEQIKLEYRRKIDVLPIEDTGRLKVNAKRWTSLPEKQNWKSTLEALCLWVFHKSIHF